jgi:peptidoglycan/xylan/chitin deacetylase (PgdA/CDA1 family)
MGMANAFVHAALRRRGLSLIGWSARGFDGVSRRPDAIVARILRSVEPGAIIVLHEGGRDAAGRAAHAAALERLLAELSARGYRCVVPGAAADRGLSPAASYLQARAS